MTCKADFHIHTVLSPCGDIDMSPSMIIDYARIKKLDIIGICDHNSTKNCLVTKEIGDKNGVHVLMGAEVTSKEEVHCLCFLPDRSSLEDFQQYLENHINSRKNNPKFFGHQLVVDKKENIIKEEDKLLIQAIDQNIHQIAEKTYSLGGIFIPAHIDARRNSIASQLGFIPHDLKYDALELKYLSSAELLTSKFKARNNTTVLRSSDAHYLNDIGKNYTTLELSEINFTEIKKALCNCAVTSY